MWREELRGRISLPDSDREVIGLTLKKLGYSYNTTDLALVSDLESELEQLKIWGRIPSSVYKNAIKRYKKAHATVIDFRNRFLSNAFVRLTSVDNGE